MRTADRPWELECCKTQRLWRGARTWKEKLQTLSGSWNAVKHNGFEGGPIIEKQTADAHWELECCKTRRFRRRARTWKDELQTLPGSWNAVKHNCFRRGARTWKEKLQTLFKSWDAVKHYGFEGEHELGNALQNVSGSWKVDWVELGWGELSWVDRNCLELNWVELRWVDWVELGWIELSWLELSWVELSLFELNWVELIELNLVELSWGELTGTQLSWVEQVLIWCTFSHWNSWKSVFPFAEKFKSGAGQDRFPFERAENQFSPWK